MMDDKLIKKMDELTKQLNFTGHVLDQSAAENRDAGELEEAEADKKLADSFGVAAERIGKIVRNVEEKVQLNREQQKMVAIDFYKSFKADESPNFTTILFLLLRKADNFNFRKLRQKYPLEAKMVELWDTGKYADSLEGFQDIEKDARASFEEAE
jgi:hypothetical protein